MEQELGLIFPRWDSDRIWGWQILDPAWRREIKGKRSHRRTGTLLLLNHEIYGV